MTPFFLSRNYHNIVIYTTLYAHSSVFLLKLAATTCFTRYGDWLMWKQGNRGKAEGVWWLIVSCLCATGCFTAGFFALLFLFVWVFALFFCSFYCFFLCLFPCFCVVQFLLFALFVRSLQIPFPVQPYSAENAMFCVCDGRYNDGESVAQIMPAREVHGGSSDIDI